MKASGFGRGIVIGIHPCARGFGWAAFENPLSLFDSGLFTVFHDKNASCLIRIERLFDKLHPEVLVLETFDKGSAARSERVQRLCQAMIALAKDRSIDVAIFSRTDVQSCFNALGAKTRHEVAEAIARHVPGIKHRLPKRRNAWDSEDRRMARFSAAALVLTHYRLGSYRLLDELG